MIEEIIMFFAEILGLSVSDFSMKKISKRVAWIILILFVLVILGAGIYYLV